MDHNAVLVVFAGGPHTASRLARAAQRAPAMSPAAIFLTGREFHEPEYAPAIHSLPAASGVVLDDARRTTEGCRLVAHRLPPHSRVHAVTSNYHGPRVRWLLHAILPRGTPLTVETTPDILAADILRPSRARRLVLGEMLSWVYCLPLGCLYLCLRACARPNRRPPPPRKGTAR